MMHQLVAYVLDHRDLSKAGELFNIDDWEIVSDIQPVLNKLKEIFNAKSYTSDLNSQSVVEICLARITLAIRETETIDKYAQGLVELLESSIQHNLSFIPVTDNNAVEPPHAKIASDLLSCLFLHYSRKSVMALAIPTAVKLLRKGNKDLVRSTSSYLALATIHNARLVAQYAALIINSILGGNYSLVRVLPQTYAENREPFHSNLAALIRILPGCDTAEKLSLLQLLSAVAATKSELIAPLMGSLKTCLLSTTTCSAVLLIYLCLVNRGCASALSDQMGLLKKAGEICGSSQTSNLVKIISSVGKLDKGNAQEAVNYIVLQFYKADSSMLPLLLKELESLAELYPDAVRPHLSDIEDLAGCQTAASIGVGSTVASIREHCQRSKPSAITTISVNRPVANSPAQQAPPIPSPYRPQSPAYQKGRSKSIGNLVTQPTSAVRARQLEKIRQELSPVLGATSTKNPMAYSIGNNGHYHYHQRGDRNSVYLFPTGQHNEFQQLELNAKGRIVPVNGHVHNHYQYQRIPDVLMPKRGGSRSTGSRVVTTFNKDKSITQRTGSGSVLAVVPSTSNDSKGLSDDGGAPGTDQPQQHSTVVYVDECGTGSPEMVDACTQSTGTLQSSRHSSAAFPTDMRALIDNGSALHGVLERGTDAVRQFCEKHFHKIRAFMAEMSSRCPVPAQCTVEESGHKERMRVHFSCQERSEYCLHSNTLFAFKTKHASIWLHIMFLQIQAQSNEPVSQKQDNVQRLRICWECLPATFTKGRSFTTLVTSAFPCHKDQQLLVAELQMHRYFDVFSWNAAKKRWRCFACNHPEKVRNFLTQTNSPVLEGQLKEKKGRWKFFKRWRTRYFTLSAASLSYRGSVISEPAAIDIRSIRSVKSVSSRKGRRAAIPKAFEIFTDDDCSYVLKAKDRKNAEEWFQCLQIAVAQAQKERYVVQL